MQLCQMHLDFEPQMHLDCQHVFHLEQEETVQLLLQELFWVEMKEGLIWVKENEELVGLMRMEYVCKQRQET